MKFLYFFLTFLLGITVAFGLIYLFNDELFPTEVKTIIKKVSSPKEIINPTQEEDQERLKIKTIKLENASIPILMYHHIKDTTVQDNNIEKDLSVSTEDFAKQVSFLKTAGYNFITMKDLAEVFKTKVLLPENPIVLTFDDGYEDNYTNAFPILQKNHITATVFLIYEKIGQTNYLNESQIKEMSQVDIEFGSHSYSHPNLSRTSVSLLQKEVVDSRQLIGQKLGLTIDSFCYPSGQYNSLTEKTVENAGYTTAVTTNEGLVTAKSDPYAFPRIRIRGRDTLKDFVSKLP
jgi:peptidoglycan/xylan/chitin deacetylase (PgdA/CDA1 family)